VASISYYDHQNTHLHRSDYTTDDGILSQSTALSGAGSIFLSVEANKTLLFLPLCSVIDQQRFASHALILLKLSPFFGH
jgi:hypothetical protein